MQTVPGIIGWTLLICNIVVNPGFVILNLWKKPEDAKAFEENRYFRFLVRMLNFFYYTILFWYSTYNVPLKNWILVGMAGYGVLSDVIFSISVFIFIETKERRMKLSAIFFSFILAAALFMLESVKSERTHEAQSKIGGIVTLIMSVITMIPAACELKLRVQDPTSKPIASRWYYMLGSLGFGSLFVHSLSVHDRASAARHFFATLLDAVVFLMFVIPYSEIRDILARRAKQTVVQNSEDADEVHEGN